jgi:hypothetical protein
MAINSDSFARIRAGIQTTPIETRARMRAAANEIIFKGLKAPGMRVVAKKFMERFADRGATEADIMPLMAFVRHTIDALDGKPQG